MAVSDCEEGPEYDYAKDLTFRVYNLTGEAQAAVYRMDQSKAAELTARREASFHLNDVVYVAAQR